MYSSSLLIINMLIIMVYSSPSGGHPKFPQRGCGYRPILWSADRGARVVGGHEPPPGAVPWQVQLRIGTEHRCGGVLLAPRLLLTVAHCWTEGLVAVLGAHTPQQQVIPVERVVKHPEFRKSGPYSNDIAILVLPSPGATLSNAVQAPCLPVASSPLPGTWCEVSGWGAVNPAQPQKLSPVLKAAAIPILSLDICRKGEVYGGRQQAILDSMICAGRLRGGVDACGGDSGGPLVCEHEGRMILAGLVSWGDGCARKDRPGVYTRVESYLDWIRNVAKKLDIDYY